MKKICLIGGGTGSYTVLSGLKSRDVEITAIVAMSDDGGSSGILRDEFGVLPPGDIRKCITALSESPEIMRQLFQYRFERGGIKGHAIGNIILTALREIMGDDQQAIKAACKIFSVKGRVIPVTLNNVRLNAELENGMIIHGEAQLDIPKHDGNLKIKKIFFDGEADANEEAVRAILEADLIVIGPGDLYGSIASNLIVKGIPEAIIGSNGKKVYICNIMTKYGETNNFDSSDFYNKLVSFIGKDCIDYFIINNSQINRLLLMKYKGENAEQVRVNTANIKAKCILENVSSQSSMARHDPEKLARVIFSLLE